MAQYIHEKWGVDQGFLGGTAYSICQSDDGYLWIGTERGLVRFDGFNFILIQRPVPDLPAIGAVRGLVADGEGDLWVRMDGPQLLVYRDGKFHDAFSHFNLHESGFTAMAEGYDGGLLLAGLSGQVLRYKDGQFHTAIGPGQIPGAVLSLTETADHIVWAGTQSAGLFSINHGHLTHTSKDMANKSVNTLLPAYKGGLWIGTDTGIQWWHDGGLTEPSFQSAIEQRQILSVTRDRDANLWAGTDRGLLRIAPSGDATLATFQRDLPRGITTVYEDRDKDLWFGGPNGIERLQDGVFKTYSIREKLPSKDNGPIYVDDLGRVWFAPLSGGLYWLKDDRVGRVTIDGLDKDIVYSISGGDGEVWIGRQHGGLTKLTKSGDAWNARTFTRSNGLPQDSVYSVFRTKTGSVWAGTVSGGVIRLEGDSISSYSTADGLASNSINSIAEGSDGTMWFATPSGLSSLKDGHWTNRSVQDGLPSNDVSTIFEDSKQTLWIGTSAGLAFCASGHIGIPRNMPEPFHEQVFGIAEDSRGELWIATSDHALKADRDRMIAGTLVESDFRVYGIADGLNGVETVRRERSLVADGFGRVWISLAGGLAEAHPGILRTYIAPVFARIESMSAGGNTVSLDTSPKLAAGSRSITINYQSTILSRPERVRYRYMLDGSGQGWSADVAARQVVYSNLKPGSYRFRILASDGDGLWNGPETVLPFEIEPEFWETRWFEASCLVACIFAIVMFYRLRMYQLTRQLNVRFQDRLAERTRIAQDLHDTLLQGVMSASLQLDVAEDQLPDDSPARPLLRRVLVLMGRVTEEGRNALRGLRAPEVTRRDLEIAFSCLRQEFPLDEKVSYRVIANGEDRALRPVVRDEVYRIGREAIVNAFVHAKANNIEVEVEYANDHFRVLVRDDGIGMDRQVLRAGREGHWGLPGMRERSESIGASLKLRSRTGAGTEVELTIPGAVAFEHQFKNPNTPWFPWLNKVKFKASTNGQSKRS